jgi:uncharacterized membrane protein YeiH
MLHPMLGISLWGNWSFGDFTIIDLIAATTNAFIMALLARRRDHYKHFTVVGIILLALIGGIAGGVSRDVILNTIPGPLINPWYTILTVAAAVLGLRIAFSSGQEFREGLFQFMTAFSLPWYAAIGVGKALDAQLPAISAIIIGVVGATAGRFVVDLSSTVTPKQFVRGEWFVGTAVLASVVYVACAQFGLSIWPATLIAFGIAFVFRLTALFRHWEEPEPWEPEDLHATEVERPRFQDLLHREFEPHDGSEGIGEGSRDA